MFEHSIVPPSVWSVFVVGVVILLLADIVIFHRKAHEISIPEAFKESLFWISVAAVFNAWFWWKFGPGPGIEFLTGYVMEKSLSVDNLFVILLVFKAFHVPAKYQHRVLFWGILGAIVFRGILIVVGIEMIHRFHWIMYVFGAILLVSAVKFLISTEKEGDITHHWSVEIVSKFFPLSKKPHYETFTIIEEGRRKATLLFMALVVIEATDIIFALDSIPAVFGITKDPFIAFASNILAILGLRSLYFVISDIVGRFHYLKQGLAAILGFVGTKMLIADIYHIPAPTSLLVIVVTLVFSALASWKYKPKGNDA